MLACNFLAVVQHWIEIVVAVATVVVVVVVVVVVAAVVVVVVVVVVEVVVVVVVVVIRHYNLWNYDTYIYSQLNAIYDWRYKFTVTKSI